MKILGLVLILLGGLALYFRAVPYTSREKVLDVGPLHASADVDKQLAVPPLVGAALLGVGILLLVVPSRRRR